jgi:hypothetical protein
MLNTLDLTFKARVHKLQHQAVRDLAWCCFSAPMMHELPESDAAMLSVSSDQLWPWLCTLDQQPEPLLAHIAQVKSTRLGIYYETLWRFYFSHRPEWELLQHNLQVERRSITLGAFDFLCRRGNEYWHIETAVKFYLCNTKNEQDAHNWRHWIGPSSHDRLDIKLAHLRQHQLPLHQTAEAKTQLQALYPQASDWKTGLCLQGYLFSPAPMNYGPAFSQENHGSGHWWYLQDFLHYVGEKSKQEWIIVERQRWLSPVHSNNSDELICGTDLIQQLQKQVGEIKRPLLIAAMKKLDKKDDCWQEGWRGFVVPDTWPEI